MSRHHHIDRLRSMTSVRRAALKRAGWRSEVSGLAGRLECPSPSRRSLRVASRPWKTSIVLTREEHRALHRPPPDPDREAWTVYLEEQL